MYRSVPIKMRDFIKMRAAHLLSPSFITRGRMGASKAALILKGKTLILIGHYSSSFSIMTAGHKILEFYGLLSIFENVKSQQVVCICNVYLSLPLASSLLEYVVFCPHPDVRHVLQTVRIRRSRLSRCGRGRIFAHFAARQLVRPDLELTRATQLGTFLATALHLQGISLKNNQTRVYLLSPQVINGLEGACNVLVLEIFHVPLP